MAPARRWPPLLRSGNAGSNTAADHIELLDAALAGLPAVAEDADVVVRGDAGYAVKDLLAHAVWWGVWVLGGF